jgi:hypothetical protein
MMSLSKLMLIDDPWVGVPSRQRHCHWEVVRQLVLERATDDVLAVTRRISACRHMNGWRPCRATEIAAAEQDVFRVDLSARRSGGPYRYAVMGARTGSHRDVARPVRQ